MAAVHRLLAQPLFTGNLGISLTPTTRHRWPTCWAPASPMDARAHHRLHRCLGFVIGTDWLGMLVGWRRGSWLDSLIPVTTLLSSIPLLLVRDLRRARCSRSSCGWFPLLRRLFGHRDDRASTGDGSSSAARSTTARCPRSRSWSHPSAGLVIGMRNMMVTVGLRGLCQGRAGEGAVRAGVLFLRGAQRGPAAVLELRARARVHRRRVDHDGGGLQVSGHWLRAVHGGRVKDYPLM